MRVDYGLVTSIGMIIFGVCEGLHCSQVPYMCIYVVKEAIKFKKRLYYLLYLSWVG